MIFIFKDKLTLPFIFPLLTGTMVVERCERLFSVN